MNEILKNKQNLQHCSFYITWALTYFIPNDILLSGSFLLYNILRQLFLNKTYTTRGVAVEQQPL